MVTLTDTAGNAISWSSAGALGSEGRVKALLLLPNGCGDSCQSCNGTWPEGSGMLCQRTGTGREAAIRALQAAGLEVNLIKDVTPIPHNGCRHRNGEGYKGV